VHSQGEQERGGRIIESALSRGNLDTVALSHLTITVSIIPRLPIFDCFDTLQTLIFSNICEGRTRRSTATISLILPDTSRGRIAGVHAKGPPRMSDDFVAPVKGLTKALDTGIKLARRVSKSASSASAAQALQITESAQRLRKSLEGCSQTISGAYRETVGSCGEPFTKALVEDGKHHTGVCYFHNLLMLLQNRMPEPSRS